MLDIADKNIPENFDVQEIQKQLKYPFVIVEGLDATGNNIRLLIMFIINPNDKGLGIEFITKDSLTPPPSNTHTHRIYDGGTL